MEWISIKDRLPEKNGAYLINEAFTHTNHISISRWTPEYKSYFNNRLNGKAVWYRYGEFGDYEIARVTHWMPLPEPPKN